MTEAGSGAALPMQAEAPGMGAVNVSARTGEEADEADQAPGVGGNGEILLIGASGFVGRLIFPAIEEAGFSVLPALRDRERAIRDGCLWLDFDDADSVAKAAVTLAAREQLVGVIAAVGRWDVGPVIKDCEEELFNSLLRANLYAHFCALKLALRVLPTSGHYIALNGAAAREAMPGSAAVCAAGAAESMLLEVAARENPDGPVISELLLGASVAGDTRNIRPEALISPEHLRKAVGKLLLHPLSGRTELAPDLSPS